MKGCRPLTDDELRRVLERLDGHTHALRDRALIILGTRSGFRISELLSLRVCDVRDGRVCVARKKMKGQKEARTVLLHREAQAALDARIGELARQGYSDSETFIFRSRQGGNRPINRRTAWEMLTQAYRQCGLVGKIGTHGMRKTFAKDMYRKLGKDIIKLQLAMGHAEVTSTAKYVGAEAQEIDDAILKD